MKKITAQEKDLLDSICVANNSMAPAAAMVQTNMNPFHNPDPLALQRNQEEIISGKLHTLIVRHFRIEVL